MRRINHRVIDLRSGAQQNTALRAELDTWDDGFRESIIALLTHRASPRRIAEACRRRSTQRAAQRQPRGAGTMKDGVLTVEPIARPAAWHPERSGLWLRVHAFAEEGKSAQIPGRSPGAGRNDVRVILE